jgi:Rrf2 family transcriptional regulator, iron-sulfur cluster assembly transcription factor
MKISSRGLYALKVILDLSNHFQHSLVHIIDLAERQNIPPKYLEQVLTQLKKAGLIQSKKGPKGGYSLCRPPKEIYVGDIVRLTERSMFSNRGIEESPGGNHDPTLNGFFGVLDEVEEAVASVIDRIDFAEIQEREAELLSKESGAITFYI